MEKRFGVKFSMSLGIATLLCVGTVRASDEFLGTVDNDWANGANWGSGAYPTAEEGFLNSSAELSTPVPTNMWAFRMGQTGDATFNVLPGGEYVATQHSSWGSWLGMAAGFSATINQSGGSVSVYELEVGSQNGAFGYYNMSGGTTTVSGALYDLSLYIGATKNAYKNGALGGTGIFSMTGGTLLTRSGVQMGHSSLAGNGTFEVWGTGPGEIGIGSYSTNNYTGTWSQYSNSTLRVGIAADGITPIHINGGVDNSSASVLFAEGSILDVSFMGGYSEVGSWPIMVCEGTMVNAGMVLADGTSSDWGFMVTNNTLMVGYGLGWPSGNPVEVVLPPAPGRELWWTGNGGDTSSSNAANWALDATGTPATWGIYQADTLQIGNSAIVGEGVVSIVDYNGDAEFNAQNLLYIGNSRTGVFNINSGTLTFTQSTTSRQQVGLGSATGDGTINVKGGNLTLNTLRVGIAGAKGTIAVNSGALDIARSSDTLDALQTSISLGFDGAGTGDLTISGGSLATRGAVVMSRSGGASTFCVEGSGSSFIEIGKANNAVDGAWAQYAGGTLKILLDEGGITPILVRDSDNTNPNGGNVYFKAGSLLNVGWVEGAAKYGTFDVMTWEGDLVESALAFDPSVDTNVWSFEFVDTNADTTNDTLRVIADAGTTSNGTPINWLLGWGLTEADVDVDNDGDGLLSWQEYVAGTCPTNSASVLQVNSFQKSGSDFVITWQSVEGKSYSVLTNSDLVNGEPGMQASGIVGLPTETSYTSTVGSATALFYEIGVE